MQSVRRRQNLSSALTMLGVSSKSSSWQCYLETSRGVMLDPNR